MKRILESEPVRDLVDDREVRGLLQARRTGAVLAHPAFLRVIDHVMAELRAEQKPAPPAG